MRNLNNNHDTTLGSCWSSQVCVYNVQHTNKSVVEGSSHYFIINRKTWEEKVINSILGQYFQTLTPCILILLLGKYWQTLNFRIIFVLPFLFRISSSKGQLNSDLMKYMMRFRKGKKSNMQEFSVGIESPKIYCPLIIFMLIVITYIMANSILKAMSNNM